MGPSEYPHFAVTSPKTATDKNHGIDRLVVMSACQTGLGKVFEGGVFGLARAWHYAGAHQIVMSLWNVDDQATRFLMTSFIKKITEGAQSERALRRAMLEARDRYPDPALWAAFTLYGMPSPSPAN